MDVRISKWARFPRAAAGFALLIGAVHCCYSVQPLHYTDLWGHLSYGRLISGAHELPSTEPFMPLAEGVPFIDTAWLTQILGYQVFSQAGPAGIQFLHAAAISVCLALLAWRCFCRTRSFVFTALGLAVFETLNWYQFQIVRPQLAGLVCFCVLATYLTSRRLPRLYWLTIPATMAIWANMHGSFVIGLSLLACGSAGRAIEVWRRTKKSSAVCHDTHVRRLFLTTALGAVAALLNPYGLRLYSEVLSISSNPNVQSLVEWAPLDYQSMQGNIALAGALALIAIYRWSPRRAPAGEPLALLALGALTAWSARFLVWWAPLAAAGFAVHSHAAWQRYHPPPVPARPPLCNGKWTAITFALAGIALAWMPLTVVLQSRSAEFKDNVSQGTPIEAVEWIREHPPAGLIFNTYEWGDYLVWAGPPGLKVFVTSHAHLVPCKVWRDYLTVINGDRNFDEVFDRYGIDTIVVDKAYRESLISKLDADAGWKRSYDDSLATVFTRHYEATNTTAPEATAPAPEQPAESQQ
jgi:hypothetical protein